MSAAAASSAARRRRNRNRCRCRRPSAASTAAAAAALLTIFARSCVVPSAASALIAGGSISSDGASAAFFVPRRARRRSCDPALASSRSVVAGRFPGSSPSSSSSSLVIRRMSDVGGGMGERPPPGGGGGGNGNGNGRKGGGNGRMDDFLDGEANPESDNLRRAREMMAEDSLPISFGYDPSEKKKKTKSGAGEDEDGEDVPGAAKNANADRGDIIPMPGVGAAAASVGFSPPGAEDVLALAENPYLDVVSRLSPSDVISKFTSTAHPRVQDAVRTTILGLVGNLPKLGFDAATVTTGERLASLMFQLQMTGYMFKNAEYRLSLTQSLGMTKPPGSYSQMAKDGFLLEGGKKNGAAPDMGEELAVDKDELEDEDALSRGKVKGKIRVRYGKRREEHGGEKNGKSAASADDDDEEEEDEDDADGDAVTAAAASGAGEMEVEVDAEAYLTELRSEVSRLRDELTLARKTKEDALRKDLLMYIRTMSQDELRGLTGTMSPDVLGAMKGLVNVVMAGIGEGRIGPDTVTEQSGEAMAQLCMWQLVVGYNLRELEVREEMRAALRGSTSSSSSDDGSGDGDREDGDDGSAFM